MLTALGTITQTTPRRVHQKKPQPTASATKPPKAAARKVVRPDAGPWDDPKFVWGLDPWFSITLNTPQLVVYRLSPKGIFNLTLGENSFELNLENPNWSDMPHAMSKVEYIRILNHDDDQRGKRSWKKDKTFFLHFPQCRQLEISNLDVPSNDIFNPKKLVRLGVKCNELQAANKLASLPPFENLRTLELTFSGQGKDSVVSLEPLSALNKLQALSISMKQAHWSAFNFANLKQALQNNPDLREICLTNSDTNKNVELGDVLKNRLFRYVSLTRFSVRTLSALDARYLKGLMLAECGVIEEGFSEHPSHLRSLLLIETEVIAGALKAENLESLEELHLYQPSDLSMLSSIAHLKNLWIEKKIQDEGDHTPLTCLENLDILPLSDALALLHIEKITPSDARCLFPAIKRQPALQDKIALSFIGKAAVSLNELLKEYPFEMENIQEVDSNPS